MKKIKLLIILFIILLIPINVNADDIHGGGGHAQGGNVSNPSRGLIRSYHDIGMRITLYNEKGNKVSNSVDVVFSQNVYDRFMRYGSAYNTLGASYNDKIDYLKGKNIIWNYSSLKDKIVVEQNNTEWDADIATGDFPKYLLRDNAQYWSKTNSVAPQKILNKLQACKENYDCQSSDKFYAVVEPTMYVYYGGEPYYGSAYELAFEFMANLNTSSMNYSGYYLGNWVNNTLPRSLTIIGSSEYSSFYQNIGITEYCSDSENCYATGSKKNMTKNTILTKGVGISVYDWTNYIVSELRKDMSCNVNVNINECGESSIYEANYNQKECIVDNAAYSYVEGCNLYCSDEITTNFSGFYQTFVGNNSLGAINSGKYISIKSNPTITIKKTCYQSSKSNECPNITSALNNKLNSDYRTNKIYLNLDGRKYDLIGNASISTNGLNATITYEYKLDSNVNKYIDIETMKGVLQESNITYTNENSMIITSKSYYGKYTYNLDVSETVLNKYTTNSAAMKKLINTQSTKYNFKNTISINYSDVNGNKKNNYVSKDLNETTCSYIKYNSDIGCICPENKCCDSITCEEIECPPDKDGNVCKCTGKYGCYDDGKCTPIEDPNVDNDGNNDGICDPEKRTCFPNLIYRPISLIEPFPGILGNGRTPGSNWNKIYKTSDGKGISYSEYYITSRRGYKDYEIYQAEPLYVIKLDGEKIQAIRKYNDKHDYNDFELSCVNGENCISSFLRGQAKDFSINLIESGTCKNINNYNFASCIKNKGA